MSDTVEPVVEVASPDPADDLRAAIGDAWEQHDAPEADRDDKGRFANPDAPAEPVAEPEAPVEAAPAIPPPATLGADDVSRWATLPREAQEFLSAREAKAQETARAYEPGQNVLKQ